MQRLALLIALLSTVPLPAAGRVIRGENNLEQLYYLGADNKRYPFPYREHDDGIRYDVYSTWFPNGGEIITVSQSELESTSLARNVTVRPGTRLLRLDTDPQLYVVGQQSVLHPILADAVVRLYGANWRERYEMIVPDVFFVNYVIGEPADPAVLPEGTLVRFQDEIGAWLMDEGKLRLFENSQWMQNMGYDFSRALILTREQANYPLEYSSLGWIDHIEERLVTVAGPIDMFRRGDVDSNGEMNLTDAVRILEFLFRGGAQITCEDAADINDDGNLNISDPIRLLTALFIGDSRLPEPQWLGDDLTADDLTCAQYRSNITQIRVAAAPLKNDVVAAGILQVRIGKFFLLPKQELSIRRLAISVRASVPEGDAHEPRNLSLQTRDGRIMAGPKDAILLPGPAGIVTYRVEFTDPFPVTRDGLELEVRADLGDRWKTGEALTCWMEPSDDMVGTNGAIFGPDRPLSSATMTIQHAELAISVSPQEDRTVSSGSLDVAGIAVSVFNSSREPVRVITWQLSVTTSGDPMGLYAWKLRQALADGMVVNHPSLNDPWGVPQGELNFVTFVLAEPVQIEPEGTTTFLIDFGVAQTYRGTVQLALTTDAVIAVGATSGETAQIVVSGPTSGPTITVTP